MSLNKIHALSFLVAMSVVTLTQQYPSSCQCSNTIAIGSNMMGGAAVSSNTYTVAFQSGSTTFASGSTFEAGTSVSVVLNKAINADVNYLIEATSGVFTDAYVMSPACTYSRTINEAGTPQQHTLFFTKAGTASIYIAWQNADAAVYISPSYTYTVTGNATGTPPSGGSSGAAADSASGVPHRQSIGIGIVIGFGAGFLALLAFATRGVLPQWTMDNIAGYLAVLFALINFALVMAWATDSGGTKTDGFLMAPSWSDNPFPYHPVLMVVMVLNFQIAVYVTKDFLDSRNLSVVTDLLYMMMVIGLIISLTGVNEYLNPDYGSAAGTHKPSINTIHSWIGVTAVIMLLLVAMWKFTIRVATVFSPHIYNDKVDWSMVEYWMPLAAFFLTSLAACTGVNSWLNQNSCNPGLGGEDFSDPNTNAQVYPNMPEGCKIGNGLGICVALSCVATVVVLKYRGTSIQVTNKAVETKNNFEDGQHA